MAPVPTESPEIAQDGPATTTNRSLFAGVVVRGGVGPAREPGLGRRGRQRQCSLHGADFAADSARVVRWRRV